MKYVMMSLFLMVGFEQVIFSHWQLGTIYNQSDLSIDSAWRDKNGKQNSIPAVTKILVASKGKQEIVIDYTVSQKLGVILMHATDANKKEYEIFFDGYTSHAIESQRAKTKSIAKFELPIDCSLEPGSHCARVFLKGVKLDTVLAQAMVSFKDVSEQAVTVLNVTIKGKAGVYTFDLGATEKAAA